MRHAFGTRERLQSDRPVRPVICFESCAPTSTACTFCSSRAPVGSSELAGLGRDRTRTATDRNPETRRPGFIKRSEPQTKTGSGATWGAGGVRSVRPRSRASDPGMGLGRALRRRASMGQVRTAPRCHGVCSAPRPGKGHRRLAPVPAPLMYAAEPTIAGGRGFAVRRSGVDLPLRESRRSSGSTTSSRPSRAMNGSAGLMSRSMTPASSSHIDCAATSSTIQATVVGASRDVAFRSLLAATLRPDTPSRSGRPRVEAVSSMWTSLGAARFCGGSRAPVGKRATALGRSRHGGRAGT